jgi:hypothetical protein
MLFHKLVVLLSDFHVPCGGDIGFGWCLPAT